MLLELWPDCQSSFYSRKFTTLVCDNTKLKKSISQKIFKNIQDDDCGNGDDYDHHNGNYVVMIILMTKYLLRQFCAEIYG